MDNSLIEDTPPDPNKVKWQIEFALRHIYNGMKTADGPGRDRHYYMEKTGPEDFAQMSKIAKQVADDYLSPDEKPPVTDIDKVVKFCYTVGYKLVNPDYPYGSVSSHTPNEWPGGYLGGDELRAMLDFASRDGEYMYEQYRKGKENKIRRYLREKTSPIQRNREGDP